MGIQRQFRRWVGVAVICCMCLATRTSNASDSVYILYVGIGVSAISGITGAACAAANLTYAIKGERPSESWLATSWVFSALNLAAGIGWLVAAREYSDDNLIWISVSQLAVSAMDIGFTYWASGQQEKKEQKLTISPMIMPDVRGRPAVGVGLRLVDW